MTAFGTSDPTCNDLPACAPSRAEIHHLPAFSEIRKRDGRLVPFDTAKITSAILRAGKATGEFSEDNGDVAKFLSTRVVLLARDMLGGETPTVEGVQDLVEEVLLASPYKKTAKAYIVYRDQRARVRDLTQKADLDLVDNYLDKLDWQVKENSNMAFSLQGLNNYVSSEVSRVYWLNKLYSSEIREAHESGDLHLHDLGTLAPYCVGWDLEDLLREGFRGVAGKAESRPARHLRTALGQVANFFYTLQGEAAGAQAFSSLDTLLAPFIRYDGLTYSDTKQALQEFVFNLNVPTRVGFQTPFTNISLDLRPPEGLRSRPVIIGGELQEETYGEFQAEMDQFNQALVEVLAEGDARGRAFTFPIPTYSITPDFDWDNPHLEGLWRATARYGIPYFANFVNSDMSPDDARSMCCRLRLDLRALERRGGGLFGANPLTGSIGVVTINMPRIALLADDEEDFLWRLDRLMDIARSSLDIKRKVLEQYTEANLYPYSKFYLRDAKERHGCYWHNHFSTIGLVGMNEACLNLLDADIGTPNGLAFAARVLDHMRYRLAGFQRDTGHLYNLEATPAESAGHRLACLDAVLVKKLGLSLPQDPTDSQIDTGPALYTNSTQLPVDYCGDVFTALDLQDGLQRRYTGGTVFHVFLGEASPDPGAVKAFVRTVCQEYSLPYFTISPTFSICADHGYLVGEQSVCPQCGKTTEVYSRVVGYLRPVSQWNDGKQAEFLKRREYVIGQKR
ncbi:MAG: ribonucleoside triphosphate reductase [Thermoleophilia bacterium]|jgi:anaerobic ribonucleoside-triphosphate reductase